MVETPALPPFDVARLVADLRKGDREAIKIAYRQVFAGEVGRFVLAHHMAECGVGQLPTRGQSTEDRHFDAGLQHGAVMLMLEAGFSQHSAVVAVMSDVLEGQDDDRNNQPFADQPDDFGDL